MTSFAHIVAQRRSIRRYETRQVGEAEIRAVLDLARHAPSSMNGQPCHFVVIRERDTLRRIAAVKNRYCPPEKRAYPADFIADAPLLVAVCVERERSFGRGLENGVLATGFLLLAARAHGLGSVFLTAYQHDEPGLAAEIGALLSLPESIEPIALVPLGFPAEQPPDKELRPLPEIVHHERFARELPGERRHAP